MSTYKLTRKVDGKDVPCGCEFSRDARGREAMTMICDQHRPEFNQRHAAAVLSCSHMNQDLVV
jgi:hypothetical protein